MHYPSELAATSADKFTSSARGSQVAKIADGSVILQTFAICSEEEGLPQLASTSGISGQRDNIRIAATEQAANSANFCASTMASLQVAEIAHSSVVSQVYANSSEEERPPQLPSTFGTSGQRRNARTAASEQAATSANSYASTIRGLQVAEVADSSVVSRTAAKEEA